MENQLKPKIIKIDLTCSACPSQWDMWDEDGNYYYVRYRWGNFRVDNESNETMFSACVGDEMDGSMSTHEMKSITNDLFEYAD